jgi:PAS domain S-box-containing protein
MKSTAPKKPAKLADNPVRLRRRAEALLREQWKIQRSKTVDLKSETDTARVLHELEVYQVELEMQNAELKKARDELEVTLEKYTDLYDFAPVSYFTLAADGNIQLVNLTGARLVRIERSRLVGQFFGLLVSAEFRPAFNSFLKQVFADQARQSGDFEISSNGQPPRTVNIEAQRLPSERECRAVVVDITERKQVEEKVRVSEIRYRRLFEAAHDGVLILDPATRKITDANPFMTKLLGYSQDQLVGKELFEIGLLKDEAASQEAFEKLKRKHEVRYENLPLESQGGRHQEVEVVANLYQENGHPVIQCNIRDITERKKAEQELSEKARLLDLSHDAIIVRDLDGCIRYWNHGAEELYGWSRAEVLGKMSHILLQTKFPIPLRQMTEELHRKSRWIGELVHTKRNGRRITVLARKTLDRDSNGHPVAVLENITDITDRKQAEAVQRRLAVLTASNRKLEKEIVRREAVETALQKSERHQRKLFEQSHSMQEQLRQLSHQILHAQEEERKRISRELHDEIAQILVGINIHLVSLTHETANNPKSLRQKITQTQRLVEESVEIVHRFARELRPTVLDDLGLIPALHSFMKEFMKRTGVRVRFTTFSGVEKLNSAQRTVLFRVAQEALTNVARHAQATRVEASIQKLPGAVRMQIKDNGKSFQVEQVLHAKKNKSLGLLGIRERLEMVGGSFNIASAPGRGTTIQVQIPLARGGGRKKSPTNSVKNKS